DRDLSLLGDCALPRLRAVVDGRDTGLEQHEGEIRLSEDAYIPWSGGGRFLSCSVGEWLFEQGERDDFPTMNRAFAAAGGLASAILTSQGFLPVEADASRGTAPDGS